MARWLVTLCTLWVFFELALVSLLGVGLVALLWAVTWPFDRQCRLAGRLYRRVAVTIAALSPLWRVRRLGALPAGGPGRAVVVCNHRSLLDVFFIASLPWEMKWLAKRSLFRVPIIGWGMWLVGDVPLRRGDGPSARQAMRRCADYLAHDMPVFVFPEGTRSVTDDMLPFKPGAFRLAIESRANILPVAIRGSERGLAKFDWRLYPADVVLHVGAPISTAGMSSPDAAALALEARAAIAHLLTLPT